ncbi:MAG: M3 family oligoendopeptidase [Lachnospiraceae bacterium]|nr:M3 family oligoendopeptidase [Lachnospiraceae bacterium]
MNNEWSLDVLYKGFDDPAFIADFKTVDTLIEESHTLSAALSSMSEKEGILAIISFREKASTSLSKLFHYVMLRQTTDTTNPETTSLIGKLTEKESDSSKDDVIFDKFIANASSLDQLIEENDVCKEYAYYLRQIRKNCSHLLSDDVEEMISKMNLTAGGSWASLFDYLTSTVEADYNGEKITLSAVRNLAYSSDASVRKAAYDAEIACYEKIKDPIAYALNNIKKQVNMLSEKRGYESPLAMTLEQSRMSKETLDALWTAVEEYLPKFQSYLKRKGELLGYKNGLPWFEMYAAIGKSEKTFTVEEAREYLISHFSHFSKDMADMMTEAFDHSWIDFFPRPGKVGGAFCDNLTDQKQSRVLTNFDGTLNSIGTLAHELGHAYHGLHIQDHKPLNTHYTMPVAETASTFNENVIMSAAIDQATGEEKLALIESQLQDFTQTICDIYSRFVFENTVFNKTKDEFLFPDQLKVIMTDAQIKAYGEGLDPEYRHPFMWTCKGHYYSEHLSYYNFPYAFGALFSKGLYAMYRKEGESFVPKYQELLKATTICDVEDVAKMVGADITKPDFWRESLQLIADSIDQFMELTK